LGLAILGGVLGGVLAGIVYPFAAANLLPHDLTETLIPKGTYNRLLWIGLAALSIGGTIPGMKWNRSRRS
jgi:prolipoprotein diacylglyceryltransferase